LTPDANHYFWLTWKFVLQLPLGLCDSLLRDMILIMNLPRTNIQQAHKIRCFFMKKLPARKSRIDQSSLAQMLDSPFKDAFGRVIALFFDSSGRCSRGTSVTSLIQSTIHPACCSLSIDHSTLAADSSFDIQRLISANSSFRVRLWLSRCNGPKPVERNPQNRERDPAGHWLQ
jgi:hypothetical protein